MSAFNRDATRRAFTLIELLTVILIIGLLAAILVPALSSARVAARKAATASQLDVIGKGCELFKTELDRYPQSRGPSPFHKVSSSSGPVSFGGDVPFFGAQWVALQLSGANLQGFVDPSLKNDAKKLQKRQIDEEDWNEWYSLDPERDYPRSTYVNADGKNSTTLNRLIEGGQLESYDESIVVDAVKSGWWGTGDLPIYVDNFDRPILYYAANVGAREPFTTGIPGDSDFHVGRYDQADNAGFTGSNGKNGQVAFKSTGMRFAGQLKDHPLKKFTYKFGDTKQPEPDTFESVFFDRAVFENTLQGSDGHVVPHRPDSFILISAGYDGTFGTGDDVRNYQSVGD